MQLLFDMDGTLVDSGCYMTEPQRVNWLRLRSLHDVTVVSGAMRAKILEHVPGSYAVLAQSGNDAYDKDGVSLWRNVINGDTRTLVTSWLDAVRRSGWSGALDVQDRGCQISVSLLGHDADINLKAAFDPGRKIRQTLLDLAPAPCPAVIGGTTCIDFYPPNASKGDNVARYIAGRGIGLYFGDAVFPGGNDWSVVGCGPVGVVSVRSPIETHDHIARVIAAPCSGPLNRPVPNL